MQVQIDPADDRVTGYLAVPPREGSGPWPGVVVVLGYHHSSSEDAWRRVFGFFDEHLGRPS